jgi:zinc transport system permease protein
MEIFQYDFMLRGLTGGVIVAFIAPIIGIFLVLKRYSLIADTLAHVSLLGVAVGLLLGFNPFLTAVGSSLLASWGVEKLRTGKRVYGETALALFLSGSLALAAVILSLYHNLNFNLFSYLFGSIVTVSFADIIMISILALVILATVSFYFKDLIYVSFDEDLAQVSGVRVKFINMLLIMTASLAIALAIPIVGALLISALVVIPVVTALQLRKSFLQTIFYAEFFSIFSVISGIFLAYYLNLSTGGTIVLVTLGSFIFVWIAKISKVSFFEKNS